MNKFTSLYIIFAAILMVSCAQVTLSGSGNIVTQDEAITGFDKVDIQNSFNADITQGENFRVMIRVDDNLVDYLKVEKEGSTLRIRLDPGRSYMITNATMEAEVTMPALAALELSGSSDATISGFESSDNLALELSGNSRLGGDIQAGDTRLDISGNSTAKLSGSAGSLQISASGSSDADLGDFPGEDGTVDASGSSTVTVNLNGRLDADASGNSDIFYLGNPELGSIETSGSSSVQPK
jgi:hypothetical protein